MSISPFDVNGVSYLKQNHSKTDTLDGIEDPKPEPQ